MTHQELLHFLEPVKPQWARYPGISEVEALGTTVAFNNGEPGWFTSAPYNVVLVGVPEARNSMGNNTCREAPGAVRHWLYGMRKCVPSIRMADAGNVRGNNLNDRYQALQEVVKWFTEKNSVVIVIGGSQELSVPLARALKNSEQELAVAVVDAGIDMDETDTDFSALSFINALINEPTCRVDDLTVMGCQYYYYSLACEEILKKHHFSLLRLSELRRSDFTGAEVPLRDASLVSFDFRAIEKQTGWLPGGAVSPGGLSVVEACRLMWYAGASDLIKVGGLFEMPVSEPYAPVNGPLAAQMIWHFIEGIAARCGDYPFRSLDSYKLVVVPIDKMGETLNFYHNTENDRWWMEVPGTNETRVVACNYSDYSQALNQELPEKWWRFLKKN